MSLTLTLARGGGEVSGSGTNIELDGTISGGAIESVEMYGDTEQTTYSGKNLLNITKGTFTQNGITFTQNQDGSVTMNGTSTGNAYYEMNNTAASQTTITSGVRYTLSIGNVTLPSGQVIVQLRKVNPNTIYCAVSDKSASFTAPETTTTFTYIGVYGSGVTLNNVTIYPMLEVGSSMTSFEPYVGGTASPNPDYPQEVQTVTGRQVVTISDGGSQSQEYEINLGKNLFRVPETPDYVNTGTTYTKISEGSFSIEVSPAASWKDDRFLVTGLQPNTTYTFKATFSNSNSSVTNNWFMLRDGGINGTVLQQGNINSSTSKTFTTTDNTTIAICLSATVGTAYENTMTVSNIQLEKGSTATTYAPYFTPIELCKIGTYQDYIYKSGEDWYVKKNTKKLDMSTINAWARDVAGRFYRVGFSSVYGIAPGVVYSNDFTYSTTTWDGEGKFGLPDSGNIWLMISDTTVSQSDLPTWLGNKGAIMYGVISTPTDTQITNATLIAQLNALNAGTTYDDTTIITVASENLAGSLEVKASATITKTYTEVEIGSPFTIADVEGKSSNTTLDGNVYVDWAYNKKQYSFDLFNLTPQDYADIRAYYDYQFNNSAFPTITVPELNIDKLPVYMEISSRNIINQCLLTDKLTIKFRETVQP